MRNGLSIVLGESGSGKTTLIKTLVLQYPDLFRRVVTCTSRPARKGEKEGIDYFFRPESFFEENPSLVLVKKTGEGVFYGTKKSDLSMAGFCSLLASKASALDHLLKAGYDENAISIIKINIDPGLKIKRMKNRGDSNDAISRRLLQDEKDKASYKLGSFPRILELSADSDMEENARKVFSFIG